MSKKIMHLDDERSIGNEVIVTLNYGWRFDSDPLVPTHVMGFDTITEAKRAAKYAIKCSCQECKNYLS